jgi:hypothetical protein
MLAATEAFLATPAATCSFRAARLVVVASRCARVSLLLPAAAASW